MGRRLERHGRWAAKLGMNLQSSTLKFDESGKPLHVQQAEQIGPTGRPGRRRGTSGEPRVSVSRSIFALRDERDWQYFGRGRHSADQMGNIDERTRAVFGRSYAAEPDELVAKLAEDEAIAAADTLLLTVPNQLGVDYNAHVIETILKHVAPAARLALTRRSARRGEATLAEEEVLSGLREQICTRHDARPRARDRARYGLGRATPGPARRGHRCGR